MISFMNFGSEKRVCRFPCSNKLADARKEVASNFLIKNLTPF